MPDRSREDAGEMFELISLAFPGFYQPRTYEMGSYYGMRVQGKLLAMAGERLCMTGYREISGVCTHPAHAGKGYARALLTRLMQDHAAAGVKSFLHVGKVNQRAAAIYERMGFRVLRALPCGAFRWLKMPCDSARPVRSRRFHRAGPTG